MSTKGLGKGLGALMSMFDEEDESVLPTQKIQVPITAQAVTAEKVTVSKGVQEIDLSLIDNNIDQPRKDFDADKLQELAESIKANGVIQPIVLKSVGTRFMIIAGERRWRASRLAGLKTIPVIVRDFTPAQIAEIAIIENLQRQDLNEIELARGIQKLINEFGLTQEQVAVQLGKNRSLISHTLRLLTLPAEIIEFVEKGKLSAGHARCLVTVLNKGVAINLARKCVAEGLSVRELEKLVHGTPKTSGGSGAGKSAQSLEIRDLTRKLTDILSTKVTIQGDSKKGKVIIEYFTTQDLMRIRKKVVDINELHTVEELLKSKPKM